MEIESPQQSMRKEVGEADEDSLPLFSITISPPDTSKNFTDFNKECEELDSEFLMMPVNEAEYDSETQICVDSNTGGPKSFYDHFTTKRKKKKLRRGVDGPTKGSEWRINLVGGEEVSGEKENTKEEKRRKKKAAAGSSSSENKPAAPQEHQHHQDPSLLMAPGNAVPKGALENAAVRRIACGRMPPTPVPVVSSASPPTSPSTSGGLLGVPTGGGPRKTPTGFTKTAMPNTAAANRGVQATPTISLSVPPSSSSSSTSGERFTSKQSSATTTTKSASEGNSHLLLPAYHVVIEKKERSNSRSTSQEKKHEEKEMVKGEGEKAAAEDLAAPPVISIEIEKVDERKDAEKKDTE